MQQNFVTRHLQDNRSRWLCTEQTRWKLLELLFSQWWANDGDAGVTLKQHLLNVLCKCLLGLSKKRISPMNCLSCFSLRQRMEAEYYKDIIITWLYLHRYRSWDTDAWYVLPCVFWAGGKTASYFYRSVEIRCSPPSKHEEFTQYCFNVGPTKATLANIETALVECLVSPCVCWVESLRPNTRAVHTSTLLVGVQLMSRNRFTRDVTELT